MQTKAFEETKKATYTKRQKEGPRNFFVPRRDLGDEYSEQELEKIKNNINKAPK